MVFQVYEFLGDHKTTLALNCCSVVFCTVANSLKTCKLPAAVNVTREEERALDNLRKDEEVTIVPADKGRSVLVMDKDEYQEKVSVLLNDTNTYLKIIDKRSNPTSNVEKELNKLLLNIKEEKDDSGAQIGPQLYKKLHSSNSTPASFYGLPKIHKPERPLRPITSSIGSPTYAVSKHLVSILPLFGEIASLSKTAQNLLKRSSNILSPVTKS